MLAPEFSLYSNKSPFDPFQVAFVADRTNRMWDGEAGGSDGNFEEYSSLVGC